MKKILYKSLTVLMIISLLLPIFCHGALATDFNSIYPYNVIKETNPNALNEAEENGTSTVTVGGTDSETEEQPQTTSLQTGSSLFDTVIAIVCGLFLIPAQITSYLLTSAVENKFIHSFDNCFTIQKCVTGEYDLFDIDVFNINPTTGNYASFHKSIRPNIQLWYIAMRNISIVLCAIIVMYIGLRMALATVTTEQAKYKKMLTNWIISLCLVFLMHFIIYALLYISNILTRIFGEALKNMNGTFSEEELVGNMFTSIWKAHGTQKFATLVMIYILVYHQLKYFILFLTRMVNLYYLVVISPLVSITYSLDKIKDSRAQAFNSWLNKIINEIFKEVPMLAIILILSMGQGEKAIKKVLGLNAPRGITSFGIMRLITQPFKMMFGGRPGGHAASAGAPH